jgi:hypothetical protein
LPPLPPPSPVLHPLHTNHQQYWLHKRRQLQRLEKIGLRKINREKEKLTMLVVLVACPPGCSTRTPSRRADKDWVRRGQKKEKRTSR